MSERTQGLEQLARYGLRPALSLELPRLDEKLFLEHFQPAARPKAQAGTKKR